MTDRIVDLAESPAYLHVRDACMVVERKGEPDATIPLVDLSVVCLAHPQITLTQGLLRGIMEHGGAILACNQSRLPVGLMLPTDAHHAQVPRFAEQARMALPTKKRLWQQIVRAKIRMQASVLEVHTERDSGLRALVGNVRSGDPSNIEAQAAKRYWRALMGPKFRRRYDGGGVNALLNYGYAVMRAMVGRAICAAGLHPSLGLHHHNRENSYCLADDLGEPFRPMVDDVVRRHVTDADATEPECDKEGKRALLEGLTARFTHQGESRTLFDLARRAAQSLVRVLLKESRDLDLPQELARAVE